MAVIDVCTEGVQRCATFLQHLATCDFSAVESTGNQYLDTLGTCTHRVLNSHLDSTTVSNLTFYLASDVISYDGCVEFRTLHLKDINLNLLIIELLQLFLQLVNVLTTFTDDDTRTGCADSNGNQLECTLDDNLRYARLCKTLVQVLTDLLILYQVISEVLASEPI